MIVQQTSHVIDIKKRDKNKYVLLVKSLRALGALARLQKNSLIIIIIYKYVIINIPRVFYVDLPFTAFSSVTWEKVFVKKSFFGNILFTITGVSLGVMSESFKQISSSFC